VPAGLEYSNYLEYLRPDFFFSCAYCTIAETEAQAIRFTIDHYEPRRASPQLTNDYDNLMYACNQCNVLKGHRSPGPNERAKGYRFFRPDQDVYDQHFEMNGVRVDHKTPVGYYTKEAIDLNRLALRRLRELRKRAADCDQFVIGGVLALRQFQLDQLPRHIKGQAARSISRAITIGQEMVDSVESLLKANAQSIFIDPDTEARSRARERSSNLKQLANALKPGTLKAAKARTRQ
jgi:hypothetical protein